MSTVSVVVGAATPSTATIVAKVDGGGPVRIAVQDDPALPSPTFFGPVAVDAQGVARVLVEDLDADSRYFFQVEDDSTLDTTVTGSFRTHPPEGQPADFTFAIGACAGSTPAFPGVGSVLAANRISNSPVFGDVADQDPLWFSHMGDLHYYDLGSGVVGGASLANSRRAYDDVLSQPEQAALYSSVAWQYVWDNHDSWVSGGTSDGTFADKTFAQQVYRERVPHYGLPDGDGAIYQQWRVGRVQFVALDSRSGRSPNADPDGPDKSMLGAAQKAWLQTLLESTPAVFLVLISPSVWHNPAQGGDTWESFKAERSELINMFRETGFLDRMCVIWGDRHAMGMDSGTLTPGGMPGMQFVALDDSTPPGAQTGWFDTGVESSENGQYGTVRIQDLGDTVEVTASGWVRGSLWRTMSFVVDLTGEGEPEEPAPSQPLAPVAVAEIRTEVTWLSCDLVTGRIIGELPDLTADKVGRVIGELTSAKLTVPIPAVGTRGMLPSERAELALRLTEPFRTMIVPVVNAVPMVPFMPLDPVGGTEATLELASVSLEGYLRYRYVGNHTWVQQDIGSVIAAGLLGDANGGVGGVGQGIGLVVDAPPTGVLRDRSYLATDNSRVYKRLQELADVQGGPEWTIDVDWADGSQSAIAKIARVRGALGTSSPAVFQTSPGSVFQSRSASNTRYKLKRRHSAGMHANVVQAYSSGQGEDQPRSVPAIDTAQLQSGVPVVEKRYQPSTSITSQEVLDDHARAELARVRNGAVTWEITARWDAWPRYGVDWRLGDDVAAHLFGHLHPDGVAVTARVIGFGLDLQAGTISPILREPVEVA